MSDTLSLRAAAKVAKVSRQTVFNWCKKYKIGDMVDGRWLVRRADLARVAAAKQAAIEALAGLRESA